MGVRQHQELRDKAGIDQAAAAMLHVPWALASEGLRHFLAHVVDRGRQCRNIPFPPQYLRPDRVEALAHRVGTDHHPRPHQGQVFPGP